MNAPLRIVALPRPTLDPEEAKRLNGTFYGTEPHDYFNTRLAVLMVAAADLEAITNSLAAGLEYGALKRTVTSETRENGPEDEASMTAYVTADALNLLHHVAETVIRLYLAHCPDSKGAVSLCPWADMADQPPTGFRELVAGRFKPHAGDVVDRRDEVITTFYLTRSAAADEPAERKRLERSAAEIERWLRHFASYYLDEAPLWNAMKHGLALRATQPMVQLKTAADEERIAQGKNPIVHQEGPAVEYLTRKGRDEPFERVTRWIRPDVAMAEAQMGTYMIEQIWTIGKTRYVDRPAGSKEILKLRFYDQTRLEQVMDAYLGDGEEARFVIKTMNVPLSYRWRYQPQLLCTACGREPDEGEKHPRRQWRGLSDGESPLRTVCPSCIPKFRRSG